MAYLLGLSVGTIGADDAEDVAGGGTVARMWLRLRLRWWVINATK